MSRTYINLVRGIFWEKIRERSFIWPTTKAEKMYTEIRYEPDCYIMFGKESAGIPEEILVDYEETCIRIPMEPSIRSLNLSNSVSIILYEALRQQGFPELSGVGGDGPRAGKPIFTFTK